MNKMLENYTSDFNHITREAETLTFITRDKEMQEKATANLKKLLEQTEKIKAEFAANQEEDDANLMLGFKCAIHSLMQQLNMWIELKNNKPDKAWDLLIEAQEAAQGAMRAHSSFEHLSNYTKRLFALEHLVFPPQVFNSAGFIVDRQECSICKSDYDECLHLVGKAYMGSFCSIILKEVEIDHVSIVESPADKRCRITHFEEGGKRRNRMTWKFEEKSTST